MRTIPERRSMYYKVMGGAATTEGNKVFGYLTGYGNIDDGGDRLWKGCAAKSIKERGPESVTPRKIAYLHTHTISLPVGKFTKLEEQDKGLYYEGELSNVPFVQDTVKVQMAEGILNNHSIGYNYVYEEGKIAYNPDDDCIDVFEIDLFEGSILTLGMNENTPFGGFKKFLHNHDHYKELAEKSEKLLKTIKSYNNEIELRSVIQQYQSLLNSAAVELKQYTDKDKKPTNYDYKHLVSLLTK